ncbi:MAG TPA: hypothetical protein P5114_04135, partial [Hyphomicrobiaceae bacterium]|nr:hypothetical protein [Hyphomicrobiaceae bacterium]
VITLARSTRQEGGEKRSGGLRLSRPTQRAAAPARPVGRGEHDDSLRRAAGPMNHIELRGSSGLSSCSPPCRPYPCEKGGLAVF